MPDQISALIVGGTSGIGREIAHALAKRGEEVTVTGRDKTRAQTAAAEIGGRHRGLALDLTKPEEIVVALATVGPVDHLVRRGIGGRDERGLELRGHRGRHHPHARGRAGRRTSRRSPAATRGAPWTSRSRTRAGIRWPESASVMTSSNRGSPASAACSLLAAAGRKLNAQASEAAKREFKNDCRLIPSY
jgi:hypothetical protein